MTLSLLESLPRNQLLALLEALDVSFFVKRADSVLLHISPLCAQEWGISIESVLGTRGEGVFPEDQIIGFMAKDQAVFAAGKAEQFEEFFGVHRIAAIGLAALPRFRLLTKRGSLRCCFASRRTSPMSLKSRRPCRRASISTRPWCQSFKSES